jgi:hypothetical protein
MEISPNPFYNQTEVNIFLPETESGSLQITSVDGKVITSEMLKGGKKHNAVGSRTRVRSLSCTTYLRWCRKSETDCEVLIYFFFY